MKLIYLFTALLCLNLSSAQNIKTFNKGKVVQKNYNVTVPYKDIKGLIIVQAVIKGKSYNFIVDTGAGSVISKQLADELGLKSDNGIEVSDSSNLSKNMEVVTLPSLEVGGITFKDTPVIIGDDNSLFFQCLGIDGFIGSNMMRNSIIKFSYKDKTVSFSDKLKNFNADKKRSASLIKDKMQSNPLLNIDLHNSDGVAHEGIMFDTGMVGLYDLSLSHYETFSKVNLFSVIHKSKGAVSLGIHGVETPKEHYMLFVPEINFAGAVLKNLTTTTTSGNRSRIGVEILQHGDIIIDYPGRKLYFNPNQDEPIDLAEKSWPVQPVIKENKFVVGIVWDQALNGEINEGDEIIKFGEIDYSVLNACEALTLNTKPKGDSAEMILKDVKTGETKKVGLSKK
ncbi:MAG: hypothetical protein DI539_27740 [Flavobacterium psychrophilum]|nr:MAG: hypothetical protein DI539_27740 [Flavobacterium psychrophilum]